MNNLKSFDSISTYSNYFNRLIMAITGAISFFLLFKIIARVLCFNSEIIYYFSKYTLGIYILQSIIIERLSIPIIRTLPDLFYIPYAIIAFFVCFFICYLMDFSKFARPIIGLK